jgi:serine/threonine protein kinase
MNRAAPAATEAPRLACPSDEIFTRLVAGALTDAEVRALEAHCDGCAACARALAELARAITPDRGDGLGERYRLLEPLAAGAMSVVYTAVDSKLRRKVAIKRLRDAGAGAATDRRRARFLREAQLLASLSHPNVLTVHDVGERDREIYVVMELVDGWSMSRWIAESAPRPTWPAIVDQYLQAGRGLAAAHQLGVVHRDVKPENILVGRGGRVLIGDFGLAALMGGVGAPSDGASGPVSLTQTGTVLGTPAYMAPELQSGNRGDALSDQFSFCVSLFESLHGRRPFVGQSAAEIAAAARAARLPLGADGVPRAVDRVLAKGLCADPAARFRSMTELLAALGRARDRPAPRPALVAVGLGLVVAAGWLALPHRRAPPVAVAPAPAAARPAFAVPPVSPAVPPVSPPIARTAKPASHARHRAAVDPKLDHALILYLADRAHAARDGAACLAALHGVPGDAWPEALADRAQRRRAACEMLRGNCRRGLRLLEPIDGADAARAAMLASCPVAALSMTEDRILAVTAQADDARYAGNSPARRRELARDLTRQTDSPAIQACLRERPGARVCGRRLTRLARAYQVLAESFLAAGDCQEGARLDVMQSEVRFQTLAPGEGDPALRCRAARIFDAYESCADAGEKAERRCLARAEAAQH